MVISLFASIARNRKVRHHRPRGSKTDGDLMVIFDYFPVGLKNSFDINNVLHLAGFA